MPLAIAISGNIWLINNADYGDVSMHTAVLWLKSRSMCEEVLQTFTGYQRSWQRENYFLLFFLLNLTVSSGMADLVFMADITAHISTLNCTLRGKGNFVMIYTANSHKCFFITHASFQID